MSFKAIHCCRFHFSIINTESPQPSFIHSNENTITQPTLFDAHSDIIIKRNSAIPGRLIKNEPTQSRKNEIRRISPRYVHCVVVTSDVCYDFQFVRLKYQSGVQRIVENSFVCFRSSCERHRLM